MFSLKDKVALVTGASQGIGRDTARALAEAGAKVAVAARNEEKLASLAKDIVAAGGEAFAVKMDVADAEQVKAGFKQVLEKFGRLDILVNNAAITRDGLEPRAGELCCRESRIDRADQGDCDGDCFAQYHRECSRAGIHRDADDGCAAGQSERGVEDTYSPGADGFDAGSGCGDRFLSKR